MNQETQAKKEHEELPLRQINICRQCKQEIVKGSSKCHHCGSWQSQWQTCFDYLPAFISLVLMGVAIAQLILAYSQLHEAKAQRLLASEALQRAKKAEDTVISVAKNLDKIQTKVKMQEKSIDRIAAKAEEQGRTVEAILDRVKQKFSETLSIENKAGFGAEGTVKHPGGEPERGP